MKEDAPRVIKIPAKPEATRQAEARRQLRVAAYCRVSTKEEDQANSYEVQKEYYTDKIMSNTAWTMAGIFADKGITGTSAKKREDFMRMIRHCRQKKIDVILTKSVSRFSRNTVDCLYYIRALKQLGVAVIFEKENINTLTESSEFLITLFSGFAQAESESLSKNITWGKQKSAEAGKVDFQYKKMLGYRKGADGQPEIVPEEAKIIRRIYRRYLAGCSLGQIKQELEQDNFYPLFSQELVPGTHYNLARTCATQVYITNHYKSEIVLSKIRFVAEDIEKINEPVIYVNVIENEGYVSLKFTNVGWRATGDFHVRLKGIEEDLTDYFNEDKLKLDVKNLKPKEFVEVKIWEDKNLKNHPEEYKTIPFTVECMKGNQELDVRYSLEIKKEYMSYVTFDIYEGKLQRLGRGGEAGFLYGIPINTNKKKYVYKETIEEYIEPEEIVTFPICFFPEQSCNMRFHIEFEARYGAKKIELKTE
mgnify:CR=1 FL=1